MAGLEKPVHWPAYWKANEMMRKLMVAAVLGSVLASLGACNTVKGLGRDIQSVGQAGEKAIN